MDGRWRTDKVRLSTHTSPNIYSNYAYSVDERWKGTQNALAGLFCASLGSMNSQRTTSPTRAFPPHGALPLLPSNSSYALRHAHLPSENVCTENLTPFLKLLPCPARAGIATLLNPHKLFDADWHGLGINVVWKEGGVVELTMTVQAVFDPVRTSPDGKRGELLPFVVSCLALMLVTQIGLSVPSSAAPSNAPALWPRRAW